MYFTGLLKIKRYKYLFDDQTEISEMWWVISILTHFPLPFSIPNTYPPSCWWTIPRPLPLPQCPRPVTPHRAKAEGGRAGGGLLGRSFPWCFYWSQQMASLSLCIVVVAIFLWGSGLTKVANGCRRQKPSLLPKRVSSVTKRCKTGNAVKFTAFTRCEDTTACQFQTSAGKHCLACMSQVWDTLKPSKSELCENTKLPFKALKCPLSSAFCFGLRAPNNEVGQPKSLHCFHSATVYLYYSLQYPLSSLVLTTSVSPTLLSLLIFSLFISPIFPLPLRYATPFAAQEKNVTVKLRGSIHSL